VNAGKTKYMVMSRDENAGQSHRLITASETEQQVAKEISTTL
jgi:hypothetical protein